MNDCETEMPMHVSRIALSIAALAVTAACSDAPPPTQPTQPPAVPLAQPVTLTLVQGQMVSASPHPVRLAFDAVVERCDDTGGAQSCLPSSHPERQFRIAVDGGGFAPLELVRILDEPRFQGYTNGRDGTYLVLLQNLTVQSHGGWLATVVVRRGMEL